MGRVVFGPDRWHLGQCRAREAEEQRKDKKKRKKNLGLLSFGEEAGEEEQEVAALTTKVGSAFDAAKDDDPR